MSSSGTSHRFVELWRLTKSFPGPQGDSVVVDCFDLMIQEGEFVSIIGHSGCGKSTVLSMLAGLTPWTSGGIVVAGREIDGPGPDRGLVFQSPNLLPWFSAFDNVLLGVDEVRSQQSRAERRAIVEHYLSLVGLGDSMHKMPSELSQGMRQRVGLARAFALQPKVLLLDEPFGMLDSMTRIELQDVLIRLWADDRTTAIMVTHDVDEAILLSDRVVMMTSGPAASVGQILQVPFERPRDRTDVLGRSDYYEVRDSLTSFLEDQHAPRPADPEPSAQTEPAASVALSSSIGASSSSARPLMIGG